MFPSYVSPNAPRENFRIYDPATNAWEPLTIQWKPLDAKVSKYYMYGHAPTVYDPRRQVLVCVLKGAGTWLLDPVKKTMTQVVKASESLFGNLDGPVGAFVHDTVGGETLGIFVNYEVYGGGKVLTSRGFPTDRTNVWVLDPDKGRWVLEPKPSDGVLPPLNRLGSVHHFYDPVQNATFVFRGGYNGANGECWVYRFRRKNPNGK